MAVAAMVFPLAVRAGDQLAVFTLTVNEVVKGDVLAIVRTDDILVPLDQMENAGVTGLGGKHEKIKQRTFVSLASLAPDVKYELDPKLVALKITVQPRHLAGEVLDLSKAHPPPGLVYSHDPSAFLNYSLQSGNFTSISSFDEVGLSMFGNSLLDSTFSVDQTGMITRGSTSLTIDDLPDLRRLELGDVTPLTTDPLGGGAAIGGVSISKNTGIDPYYVQSVGDSLRAEVLSPSTVEMYVNGRLVFKQDLPPGVFTLQNIPYGLGAGTTGFGGGNTELLIRDAFGREQDITQPYYYAPQLVPVGLHVYNLVLGPEREGSGGINYTGPFVFAANDSFGLTERLSPGVRLEGSDNGLLSGGLMANLGIPVGTLFLSGAVSEAPMLPGNAIPVPTPVPTSPNSPPTITANPVLVGGGRTVMGYAATATYSYGRPFYSFGGNVQLFSPHYANLSLAPQTDRSTFQAGIGFGLQISSRGSVSGSFEYSKDRDQGNRQTATITGLYRLGKGASVYLNASRSAESSTASSITLSAGISFALGSQANVNLGYEHQIGAGAGDVYTAQFSKAPPAGPGGGYLLGAQTGSQGESETAELLYHGERTSDFMTIDHSSSRTTETLGIAGAVVAIGDRVMPSQPLGASFGLVRAGGVPGVEVSLSNQLLGQTDARGDFVLGQLTAYYGNPVSINERDIPVDYRIDATKEYVAPPYRGGTVVSFPVRPVRSFVGKLQVVMLGKTVIPSFGQLTMDAEGRSFISPIGRDGAFFLDSPPLGRYPARIDFENGTCAFTINIPDLGQPFVRLGTLHCTMQ